MINKAIASLVQYAIDKGLIAEDDRVYAVNALLERMQLDSFEAPEALLDKPVDQLLDILTDDAAARGLCEDDPVCRDLFDTGLSFRNQTGRQRKAGVSSPETVIAAEGIIERKRGMCIPVFGKDADDR